MTDGPTVEVVIDERGQPVWQVCGLGICVRDPSGLRAQARFVDLCRAKGVQPPAAGRGPHRGPTDSDEPGT